MSEPIELVKGPDGVYIEAEQRPKKKKRAQPGNTAKSAAAAGNPATKSDGGLKQAAPYLRVDVFAIRALDEVFKDSPVYHSLIRPRAERMIARRLSPARIERDLRRIERKLCR